jgi:prepilin-type N-terminal cleavage/methylation domain-containing protein
MTISNFRTFTLIELLVVIAIVGLLSTIVLVSTSGLREQAEIAKTLTWARSIDSTLGPEAVGIWNFDEGVENTCPDGKDVCDISGWNNHGTMYNFILPQGYVTDTPSSHGHALSFDGVDDYVDVGRKDVFETNEGTMEVWFKANAVSHKVISFTRSDHNGFLRIVYDNTNHRVYSEARLYTEAYPYRWIVIGPAGTVFPDKWTHVLVTQDGVVARLYVNGEFKAIATQGADITAWLADINADGRYLQIGRSHSTDYFDGLIDEVRIYSTALTASQIQSHYYAGLNKLLANKQINEQEYQQRLTKN